MLRSVHFYVLEHSVERKWYCTEQPVEKLGGVGRLGNAVSMATDRAIVCGVLLQEFLQTDRDIMGQFNFTNE